MIARLYIDVSSVLNNIVSQRVRIVICLLTALDGDKREAAKGGLNGQTLELTISGDSGTLHVKTSAVEQDMPFKVGQEFDYKLSSGRTVKVSN